MSTRKRRNPTPAFKLPPPTNPFNMETAGVQAEGVFPHSALWQVVEEDTHADYLVCQGYDPREGRYFESMAVAKPYGSRITGAYTVGQVFQAWLPLAPFEIPSTCNFGPLGQNPGKAETTQGHPEDLDEAIELLYDDDGVAINWMIMDSPPWRLFELYEELVPGTDDSNQEGNSAQAYHLVPCETATDETGYDIDDTKDKFTVVDMSGARRGRERDKFSDPHHRGSRGWAMPWIDKDGDVAWQIVWMQPNAMIIRGGVDESNDVRSDAASFTIGGSTTGAGIAVLQPTGGIITHVNSGSDDPGDTMEIDNKFENFFRDFVSATEGATIWAIWDEALEKWQQFFPQREIWWGKCQGTAGSPAWSDASGNHAVSCKLCDRDGTNVSSQAAFTVILPYVGVTLETGDSDVPLDPILYTNDIIAFTVTGDGDIVAVGNYTDGSRKGDLRMISSLSAIPRGWEECIASSANAPNMEGRFPRCRDSQDAHNETTGVTAFGGTGGKNFHGDNSPDANTQNADGSTNNHEDHDDHNEHADHGTQLMYDGDSIDYYYVLVDTSGDPKPDHHTRHTTGTDPDHNKHSETDNRPKWFTVIMIQRIY